MNKVKVRGAKVPKTTISYPKTKTGVQLDYTANGSSLFTMNLIHNDPKMAVFIDPSNQTVLTIKRSDDRKNWILMIDEVELKCDYTTTAIKLAAKGCDKIRLTAELDSAPIVCIETISYRDSYELREVQAGDILLVDCCNVDCNEELLVKYVINNVAFCEIEFFTNDDLSNRTTGYCAVPLNAGYKFDVLITTVEEGSIHFERYEQLKFNRYTDGELVMAQAFDRANK